MSERTIKVDYLARVEGEGAMHVKIKDGKVEDVQLKIFEPPRFFEAFLRGRDFREAPDITARICGICPIAYELGASYAMEDACGVTVGGQLRELRRLIYCGEWIESHILHMAMLHAPDFLGYQDAIQMAKDHPGVVKDALRLKKIGNDIMVILGGREATVALIKLIKTFPMPDFRQDYEFVAMRHPKEYAIIEGRLVSNKGMDIPVRDYDKVLVESQVPHSTSLHTRVVGRDTCHVGPLARYSLNFHQLTPLCQETAREAGLGPTCFNPFQSILVRGIEVLYAFEEAIRIVEQYEEPDAPRVDVRPRAATGYGCTEAPRGICYHRYTIDEGGIIRDAKIVSPTAVNQPTIEKDLWHFVGPNVGMTDEQLQWHCEQAIRNYDPCISCSCHFLKLTVERA